MTPRAQIMLAGGFEPAEAIRRLPEAITQLEWWQARLASTRASFRERHSAEDVAAIEADRMNTGLSYELESTVREARKAEAEVARLTKDAKRLPEPPIVVVQVYRSFGIKDTLKSRGYMFSRDGHDGASWDRQIAQDDATAEIAWLESLGVEIDDRRRSPARRRH